jgi:hypothetical protein
MPDYPIGWDKWTLADIDALLADLRTRYRPSRVLPAAPGTQPETSEEPKHGD